MPLRITHASLTPLQTSADGKERQNFKRMHDLLNIDSVPAPESITDAGIFLDWSLEPVHSFEDLRDIFLSGVHRVAPPSSARGQELVHSDPELQKLNQGLQVRDGYMDTYGAL